MVAKLGILWVMRIFGPRRAELTGGWREIRKEEMLVLAQPNIIKKMTLRRKMWKERAARLK